MGTGNSHDLDAKQLVHQPKPWRKADGGLPVLKQHLSVVAGKSANNQFPPSTCSAMECLQW